MTSRTAWLAVAMQMLACNAGETPGGLAPDRGGQGPVVRFDLFARPLPEVPLPSDLATRPDPRSPTGLRVNASHVAATSMESGIREQLDTLDGWGTFSPITVAFDCEGDPDGLCLDLDNVIRRHPRGDLAFADDALYVVNITQGSPTYGRPVPLDLGQGRFPVRLDPSTTYYDNDPRPGTTNMLFEEAGEDDVDGDTLPDPAEDTNADGRLGRPNVWPPGADASDSLVTFYEFATNTLIARPVVPLREATRYAVILTERLTGEAGRPVRSPFPSINHVEQTRDLEVLPGILEADSATFGGLGLEGVRFAWSFTTQSVTLELKEIRRGLYGHGPFARLEDLYPPDLVVNQIRGCNPYGPGDCDLPSNVFILPMVDFAPIVGEYVMDLVDEDPSDVAELVDSYLYVDYIVIAHFWSPNFLDSNGDGIEAARWRSEDIDGDGRMDEAEDSNFNGRLDEGEDADGDGHLDREEDADGDGRFEVFTEDEGVWKVDPLTGEGGQSPGWVSLFITVPREEYRPVAGEPFPVAFYGHGYTAFNLEAFGFGGNMAKYGFATVALNCVHHGLGFDSLIIDAVRSVFQTEDLAPGGDALLDDRALDPDRDGVKESGGDFWTSYVMHTRDVVRQSALDHFQAIRILRSFDGERLAGPVDHDGDAIAETGWDYESWSPDGGKARLVGDYDGDGALDRAGDFDADTIVDIGGPGGRFYAWGQSLGGIMSALMGGLDPAIRAIAPTSGGGGLGDIAIRDEEGGVRHAVVLRILAPLVVTAPVTEGTDDSACSAGQHSIRFMMPDVNDKGRVEFACLEERDVAEGNVAVALNERTGEVRCAAFRTGGVLRISVPADLLDDLGIDIYPPGDVSDTVACEPLPGAVPIRTIETFEVGAEFQYMRWSEGEPLVSPAEGYGMERSTPEVRRLLNLAQMGLEAGDPINYAPHYFLDPITYPEEGEHHTNALVIGTAGDMVVPINTAAAQARAAGILDYVDDDPRYGKTPDEILIDNWVVEAIEQYGRTYPDDASGRCDDEPCAILFDPDDLDRDADTYASPYLRDPLRIFRPSVPDALLEEALSRCSVDVSTDSGRTYVETVVCPDGVSANLYPVIFPQGEHGFYIPDPELTFDINTFLVNMIGRYFQSDGTELSFAACQSDSTCGWIPPLPEKPPGWPVFD